MKDRIHYIDVYRGMCMLLVVLGHAVGNVDDPVNKVILSFHMPAFFFLSGMCFRPKTSDYAIPDTLRRKSRSLGYPYLMLSLVGVALYWLLLDGTSKGKETSLLQSFVGIFWQDGMVGVNVVPGFWFVFQLVWVTIIFVCTRKIPRSLLLAGSTLVFFSIYMIKPEYYGADMVVRTAAGLMFFTLGDRLVQWDGKVKQMLIGGGQMRLLLKTLLLFGLLVGLSQANAPVGMQSNLYGNPFMFVLTAIIGCCWLLVLSVLINKHRGIEYVGRNTLVFLLMHFFVLMTTHVLWHKVMPYVNNYTFPLYLLHFCLAVVGCLLCCFIVNRYCPWLVRIKQK